MTAAKQAREILRQRTAAKVAQPQLSGDGQVLLRLAHEVERMKIQRDDLLAALRDARNVLMIEHSLRPEYGFGQFVEDKIDPAIDKAEA